MMGKEGESMMTLRKGMVAALWLPGTALAATPLADRADNGFMLIATALVLFMRVCCNPIGRAVLL